MTTTKFELDVLREFQQELFQLARQFDAKGAAILYGAIVKLTDGLEEE